MHACIREFETETENLLSSREDKAVQKPWQVRDAGSQKNCRAI